MVTGFSALISFLSAHYGCGGRIWTCRPNVGKQVASTLFRQKRRSRCFCICFFLLARRTEKDITEFLGKSACDKAFSDFFIFFLGACHSWWSFLSLFIENRKRYHLNQVIFIEGVSCPSSSWLSVKSSLYLFALSSQHNSNNEQNDNYTHQNSK